MKALLHVHSDYSHDGEPTLEDLAAWGESRSLDFIFLTEHTNDFDQGKMEAFVGHCDSLSGRKCRLVPGLEFPVHGGFHFLGYNLRTFAAVTGQEQAARHIREHGGIGALAHPRRHADGAWPDAPALNLLHGIEAWNARYDGRFVPPGKLLARCMAHRGASGGRPLLLGGQDLHQLVDHRLVVTKTAQDETLESFVTRLRSGQVTFGAPPFWLSSAGRVPGALLTVATVLHAIYVGARSARKRLAPERREGSRS